MNTRQLELFVRICEVGSITRAAEAMHIAQPALGLQVSALERELGVRLLARTKRGSIPTAAGNLLFAEAKEILHKVNEIRNQLQGLSRDSTQTFRVGMPPSLTPIMSGLIFSALRSRKKKDAINVKIFEEMSHVLVDRVENCELDIALAYDVPETRHLDRKAYFKEELYFITARGSAADRPGAIAFRELLKWKFVLSSERASVRRAAEGIARTAGIPLDVIYTVESIQGIKEMVSRGLACGILPYSLIAQEVNAGTIVARAITDPPMTRTLYAIRSPATTGPQTAVVSDMLDKLIMSIARDLPKVSSSS